MEMYPVWATFGILFSLASCALDHGGDIGSNPRIFETTRLPKDRFMPSVGNGHVATVLHSVTIFMNGLYNGERGESRRARIPSRINIRVQATAEQPRRFILDTERGIFVENLIVNDVQIEQTTFAHRLYTPLMVVQITANFSRSIRTSVEFNLTDNPGPDSSDITFSKPHKFRLGPGKEQNGTTKVVEDSKYQPYPTPVYVIYSDVPETVTLTKDSPIVTFVMSLTSKYEEASEAYLYAMELIKNEKPLEILQSHIEQWAAIWNAGNIYLEGPNLELAKVTAGSLYYLLSSLPFQEIDVKRRRFYGLSPGSLAHGAARDYHGHSFWDTETWMFPSILLLWPNVAKDLLLYRMANAEAARENANATGYKGLRFPWESAFTGVDVTPDCCHETRDNQQHITADISFAARQYWAVTGDYSWLMGENYAFPLDINGCDFIHGMAEFWASRTSLNSETGQYEINGVMPPDEDHPYVNNSIYTNVGAAYSIFFAKHIKCICNEFMSSNVPLEWVDIARKLKLPFDANHQYHPEFDGYSIGETIKQADAVLLGYPIMHVTDLNKRKNDLEIYENVTRVTGPAMSMGMYAIAHLDLGNEGRAEWLFNRSYQLYKKEPFNVWIGATSESGTVNFITGMGGFLQSLLSGYGGIRIHIDHLSFNPKLPRGINNFTIKGLNYKECLLDVAITQSKVCVAWTGESCRTLILTHWPYDVNGATATRLSYDQRNGTETGQGTMTFSRQRFTIQPIDPLPCHLPEDALGQASTSKSSSVGKASHTLLAIFLAIRASRSPMII